MVKEVHVNPGRNPSDAYWATQPGYSNVANFRSYMTAGRRRDRRHLPLRPRRTTRPTWPRKSLAHESGHTVSQKLWGTNTNNKKWKPWRDAMKSDGIVGLDLRASRRRTRTSPSTWALFMEVRHGPREEELRLLFPARWAILATLW